MISSFHAFDQLVSGFALGLLPLLSVGVQFLSLGNLSLSFLSNPLFFFALLLKPKLLSLTNLGQLVLRDDAFMRRAYWTHLANLSSRTVLVLKVKFSLGQFGCFCDNIVLVYILLAPGSDGNMVSRKILFHVPQMSGSPPFSCCWAGLSLPMNEDEFMELWTALNPDKGIHDS